MTLGQGSSCVAFVSSKLGQLALLLITKKCIFLQTRHTNKYYLQLIRTVYTPIPLSYIAVYLLAPKESRGGRERESVVGNALLIFHFLDILASGFLSLSDFILWIEGSGVGFLDLLDLEI